MNRLLASAAGLCLLLACQPPVAGTRTQGKPLLSLTRQGASDLEVGGELLGLPAGATRYLSYKQLLMLPLVTYAVADDSNFPQRTLLTGIPLDRLAEELGSPGSRLVVAICYDGYRTNYPVSYLAAHHPFLVLKIDGRVEGDWPAAPGGRSFAPYLISHPLFKPSFQVLSHSDEPQIPYGVTRIEFRSEQAVLGSIAPRGYYSQSSPEMKGYRIAQQNCFRCHNMGREGGQMAGRSWQILGMWATTEPDYFSRLVKNPQSIDPKDRMPGSPQYDAETIEALRRYFTTFAGSPR